MPNDDIYTGRILCALRLDDFDRWSKIVRRKIKELGSITEAARAFGINKRTLFRHLEAHRDILEGIDLPTRAR